MSEVHRYKAIKLKTEAGNIITYAPHGPDFVPAEAYDQIRAELAALKAGQGEAVEVVCVTQGGCNVTWTATKELTPAGTPLMSVRQHERIVAAKSAGQHFGTHQHQSPACLIDVAEYRAMEARMHAYNEEDAEIHRAMAKQHGEHRTALQREEEKGYARALKDTGYDDTGVIASDAMPILKRLFAAETRKVREMASTDYRMQAATDYYAALAELRALLAQEAK